MAENVKHNKMKMPIVYIAMLFCLMGFGSCTTYYYSVLDTNRPGTGKMDNGDFRQETDSVSVSYCFFGQNLPVEITIANKLDQPLFLDWQQSALILDDAETYVYKDYLFQQTDYSETFGHFAGQPNMPEGVAYIPPEAMINSTPVILNKFAFEKIENKEYEKTEYSEDGRSY